MSSSLQSQCTFQKQPDILSWCTSFPCAVPLLTKLTARGTAWSTVSTVLVNLVSTSDVTCGDRGSRMYCVYISHHLALFDGPASQVNLHVFHLD
jgi:hypothetical protein